VWIEAMMMAIRYLMRAALTKDEDQLQPTPQPRVSLRCDRVVSDEMATSMEKIL
jgi:hypothetical protein